MHPRAQAHTETRLISMSKFMRTRLGAHNSYLPSHTHTESERDLFRKSAAGIVVYTRAKLTKIRKRNCACGRVLWSKQRWQRQRQWQWWWRWRRLNFDIFLNTPHMIITWHVLQSTCEFFGNYSLCCEASKALGTFWIIIIMWKQ